MSNFWTDFSGKLFMLWPAFVVLSLLLDYLWRHRRCLHMVRRHVWRAHWDIYDWLFPVKEKVFVIKVKGKGTGTAPGPGEGPCPKGNKN